MKWYLANAETRGSIGWHFHIPSADARKSLVKGDHAKLIFENEEPFETCVGERMWVCVINALGNGRYVGVLHNHPVVVEGIEHGDAVEFSSENVCDIDKEKR